MFVEKVVSVETENLFKDWRMLCTIVRSYLENINVTLTSSKIQSNINQLCDSIRSLQIGAVSNHVHIFGSRVYGLATKKTDVDLYLEIGKITYPHSWNFFIFDFNLILI